VAPGHRPGVRAVDVGAGNPSISVAAEDGEGAPSIKSRTGAECSGSTAILTIQVKDDRRDKGRVAALASPRPTVNFVSLSKHPHNRDGESHPRTFRTPALP
jgi:hypothetical protein